VLLRLSCANSSTTPYNKSPTRYKQAKILYRWHHTLVHGCYTTCRAAGEPSSLGEAFGDKNWIVAMDSEHQALMRNKAWHFVPPPKGKIKRKSDGTIDMCRGVKIAASMLFGWCHRMTHTVARVNSRTQETHI
jgi:hypothetical protein